MDDLLRKVRDNVVAPELEERQRGFRDDSKWTVRSISVEAKEPPMAEE